MLKRNSIFLTLSLILIVVLGLALLCVPKGDLHLFLCDRHTHARDIFYRYYTRVAEWFPYIVCIALLLFRRVGDGVFATACMLGSALTTQLCKHLVNAPRPTTWFATHMPDITLPTVDGVHMNEWFSFPSGHTTSFFALAFVLCILLTNKLSTPKLLSTLNYKLSTIIVQVSLFILALLGAYSRIYLSQHFALDVFAGIVVGIGITMLFYVLFRHFNDKKWYNCHFF